MSIENITWLSFGLAVASFILAIVAIVLHLLDRPRIKIVSIRPGISGSRNASDRQWKHDISSIEVIVENKGNRPALDCEAVITFPQMEALPLYPQTKQHTIDIENRSFSVQAKARIRLVGAWHITPNGGINGTKEAIVIGDFLTKGTPASVIISFGKKREKDVLTRKQAQKIIDNHQETSYLYQVR